MKNLLNKKKKMNKYVIESLKHWFRMRKYVRSLSNIGHFFYSDMVDAIGETISGKYCSLCINYYNYNEVHLNPCSSCPLPVKCFDLNSPWKRVNFSGIPTEWIKNSKEMIKALWSVRYTEE